MAVEDERATEMARWRGTASERCVNDDRSRDARCQSIVSFDALGLD
jgi:hypothetical protein